MEASIAGSMTLRQMSKVRGGGELRHVLRHWVVNCIDLFEGVMSPRRPPLVYCSRALRLYLMTAGVCDGKRMGTRNAEASDTVLAVAQTCRQIYREAAPRYYSLNTFAVYSEYKSTMYPTAVQAFSAVIGPTLRDMITKVDLRLINHYSCDTAHLKNLKGCKTLAIVLPPRMLTFPMGTIYFKEKLTRSATGLGKALEKLESVSITTVGRKGKVSPHQAEIEQEYKTVVMELNLAFQARKQAQA